MKKNIAIFVLCFSALSFSAFAQIKVNSAGYVGIITSTPSYKLDVNSGESRSWYSTRRPFLISHWGQDPRLKSTSAIVFYKTDASGFLDIQCKTLYEHSDSTAKENIIPLSDAGKAGFTESNIEKIKQLKGVNYNWKDDKTKKMQAGFLAQEVEEVIPEAVITNDSTRNKSMAYSAIIPYLVEAIKEQQAEIEELKKQLTR